MPTNHARLLVGGLPLVDLRCALISLFVSFSLGCRHALRSRVCKTSVANGELEFNHERQHSSMLNISPNRCIGRRFDVGVCIRSWGVSNRGAARVRLEYFDLGVVFSVGGVLMFAPSYRVKSRGGGVIGRWDFM